MAFNWRAVLVGIAILWCAWTRATYGRVWSSELTVWTHAVHVTPYKARPHLHLALALIEARRFQEARLVLDYTATLADPARPDWDETEARDALRRTREMLSRLAPVGSLGSR